MSRLFGLSCHSATRTFQIEYYSKGTPVSIDFYYEKLGENKDIVCVPLSGSLTSENCDYLMGCLETKIKSDYKHLILDCENLSYISSMGLGMIVRVHARMKKLGGDAKLANLHGAGAQILKLVGLNRLFEIYPNVESAVAAFEPAK